MPAKRKADKKPEIDHNLKITRIYPKAQLRKNRNIYLAEAAVDMNQSWIKGGMEGVAKIRVGPRPVWWVVFHRVIDYIQLHM